VALSAGSRNPVRSMQGDRPGQDAGVSEALMGQIYLSLSEKRLPKRRRESRPVLHPRTSWTGAAAYCH
jgi:hypothetical protein